MSIWGAAEAGNLAQVQRLVGQEPRLLNAENGFQETPLERASSRGHVRVVRWLVDQGAALDQQGIQGWTPLFIASSRGHTPVVRLLMGRGADPTIASTSGWTPLMRTSHEGHVDTVRCLLDHPSVAAMINQRNGGGFTALLLACNQGWEGVVRALLDKGADPTIADNMGRNAMAMAKRYKRRACIEALKVRCTCRPSTPLLLTGLT
jgi:ankyrin repeat protein